MPSLTLPDADIRGYYHQLGIPLPDRPGPELSALLRRPRLAPTRGPRPLLLGQRRQRRLAMPRLRRPRRRLRRRARARPHATLSDRPDDHPRTDRTPRATTHRPRTHRHSQPARARVHANTRPGAPVLDITEQDINRWQTALSRRPSLLTRLADERGWRYPAMRELGLGLDRGRITIPIRNRAACCAVSCATSQTTRRPKMLPPGQPTRARTPPRHRDITTDHARRRTARHDRRAFTRPPSDRSARRSCVAAPDGRAYWQASASP